MDTCDVTFYNTMYALFTFFSTAFVVTLGVLLAFVLVAALGNALMKQPRR